MEIPEQSNRKPEFTGEKVLECPLTDIIGAPLQRNRVANVLFPLRSKIEFFWAVLMHFEFLDLERVLCFHLFSLLSF